MIDTEIYADFYCFADIFLSAPTRSSDGLFCLMLHKISFETVRCCYSMRLLRSIEELFPVLNKFCFPSSCLQKCQRQRQWPEMNRRVGGKLFKLVCIKIFRNRFVFGVVQVDVKMVCGMQNEDDNSNHG